MSAVAQRDSPRAADEALRRQKRSFDYLWRSGVAGGFAGCAVSFFHLWFFLLTSRAHTQRRPVPHFTCSC